MKGDVLIFAPLCLLLCRMLPVSSKKTTRFFTSQGDTFPLNMAEDSVDDKYSTCVKRMEKAVLKRYFEKEYDHGSFGDAWKKSKACAQRNMKCKEDKALTDHHKHAICVYTSGYKGFYEKFNEAVRTNRTTYGTSFQYHAMHFWLTRAVQVLKKKCLTTYRRTNVVFTGQVNQIIRFGSFTSTSKLSNLTHFGEKTCFKMKTCSGAYLKKYPYLKDREQEVLIPPYEKFKIFQRSTSRKILDCETVYVLKSAGVESNLDCYAAKWINL